MSIANLDLTLRRLRDNSAEYNRKQWYTSMAVADILVRGAQQRKKFLPASLHDPVFTMFGVLNLQGRMWALHLAGLEDLMEKFIQEESQEEENWDDETVVEPSIEEGSARQEKKEIEDDLPEEYSDDEADHRKYQPVDEDGGDDASEGDCPSYKMGPPYRNARISYARHRVRATKVEAVPTKEPPHKRLRISRSVRYDVY